jgi:hypothetical protein
MDIDDLLENFIVNYNLPKKIESSSFSEYLDKELCLTAEKRLYYTMLDFFKDDKIKMRMWYFSKNQDLRDERPYDFCKKGKLEEVESLLG